MKITKRQLRQIIKEEKLRILNEEPSDYYRDYRAGSISYEEYQQMVKDYERRTGGGSYGRQRYRRKTSYVGADANAEQIAAVEKAIETKPSNFLSSVLDQLKRGRGLSSKQKSIVRKILMKSELKSLIRIMIQMKQWIQMKTEVQRGACNEFILEFLSIAIC